VDLQNDFGKQRKERLGPCWLRIKENDNGNKFKSVSERFGVS
jgi:hypothetical protein